MMEGTRTGPIWPKPLCANGTYERVAGYRSNGEPRYRRRPWRTNGELIAEVMELFSPAPSLDVVADVSYGRGAWWSNWHQPDVIHGLDVDGTGEFDDGVDFRHLPEPDETFDIIAFDPPYVATGGVSTNDQYGEMRSRFGISDGYSSSSTPARIQIDVINAGLTSVHDKLVIGGLALVKCANYISGDTLWPGEFFTLEHATRTLGMALVAVYTFDKHPSPQPRRNPSGKPRVQKTPRNNTSTLYVLQRLSASTSREAQA